jgi:hypothetical protein
MVASVDSRQHGVRRCVVDVQEARLMAMGDAGCTGFLLPPGSFAPLLPGKI